MKICPACKREYPDDVKRCRLDDTTLIPSDALFAFQPRPALLHAAPLPDAGETPAAPEKADAPLEENTPAADALRRRFNPQIAVTACAALVMLLAFSLDARQRAHVSSAHHDAAPRPVSAALAPAVVPPTETPIPPTETPIPPAETPIAPAETSATDAETSKPNVKIMASNPQVPVQNFDIPKTNAQVPMTHAQVPHANLQVPNENAQVSIRNSQVPKANTQARTPNFRVVVPTPRVRTLPSLQSLIADARPENSGTPNGGGTPNISATAEKVTPESMTPEVMTGKASEKMTPQTMAASAENSDAVPLLFGIGIGAYQGAPRHVVFLLDVSLSMPTRIAQAKAALRQALDGLGQRESFDIVTFDQAAHAFQPSLVPVTRSALASAGDWLDAQPLGPGTNLQAALDFALAQQNVNTIVVITDGVPTVGETKWEKIAQTARRKNDSRARFYTIGLVGKNPDGTDDSFEASRLLEQLARESGGECRIVPLGEAVH